MDNRAEKYALGLSALIQCETVSVENLEQPEKYHAFQELLCRQFPHIFEVCEFEDFNGSFLMRWIGRDSEAEPVMLMNHQDVVEASGDWKYPPFSGAVAEGRVWGRGTLDTKGGLWGMLQAADELAEEGFVPRCDIYFESGCNEETSGAGASAIAAELERRGLRFAMILDEGGMMLYDPIGGADGTFAMIGVGEKGCSDLKFIARDSGGHASTPAKNTPLVRLGKFMAAAERLNPMLFPAEICPAVKEMFRRMAPTMKKGPLRDACGNIDRLETVLKHVMPAVSATAGAMFRTTLAFTMAKGSDGTNVLPQEAWVIGNMRFSHHQGGEASRKAVRELAARYDIEMEVVDPGIDSPITDFNGEAFKKVEAAVTKVFPGIIPSPYLMTGASDSRFFARVCDSCIRFVPFLISEEQMHSIHTANESVDISTLAPAVDFYKYLITEA